MASELQIIMCTNTDRHFVPRRLGDTNSYRLFLHSIKGHRGNEEARLGLARVC